MQVKANYTTPHKNEGGTQAEALVKSNINLKDLLIKKFIGSKGASAQKDTAIGSKAPAHQLTNGKASPKKLTEHPKILLP